MKKLGFLLSIFAVYLIADECPYNYTKASDLQCPTGGPFTVSITKQRGKAFNRTVDIPAGLLTAIVDKNAFDYQLRRVGNHLVVVTLRRSVTAEGRPWGLRVSVPTFYNRTASYKFRFEKARGVAPCDFKALGIGYLRDPFRALVENALAAYGARSSLGQVCSTISELSDAEVANRIGSCITSANARKPVEKNCDGNIELIINVSTN